MSQIPDSANIAALTRRIRSLGRLPWVRSGESSDDEPCQSYLCDTCEKLNLSVDSFVVPSGKFTPERGFQRYLGRVSAIRRRSFCPFCRLICEITDRPLDQRIPSASSIADDPTCYCRWVIDGQDDLGPDPDRPKHHAFKPRTRRLLIYSDPQVFKDGYIVLMAENAPFKEFFGRRVTSPDLLDPDVVRSWLRTCEERHGDDCEESVVHPDLLQDITATMRVIDVNEMCIKEFPPAQCPRFITLSYLWGQITQFFTTSENIDALSIPGALRREHDKLPRTIRDTIQLTRLLGERYLWTDSLCLLHDHGFKYSDDWIYARSVLTVVAGSGKDANAGLPGVRQESRRFHQLIEEVKPGLNLMVSHLAEDYISTSQWDSRGWTFQERMLARRCLLFVNGRIYFQCRRTTFCEDFEPPADNGWSLDSIDMPTRIFREAPFVQFTSAVELYTRRELTDPNDILNAFAGVEQVLEKRLGASISFGAFESRMDSSLLWESTKRLSRRAHFPSWSWSGWLGEIQWKYTEDAQSWINWDQSPHVNLHRFAAQQSARIAPPIPWAKHPKKVPRQLSSKAPPLLHFDTVVVSFQLISPTLIHKQVVSPLRKRLTGPSALSTARPAPADPGLIRAGIADRHGNWCGTIDLDEVWANKIGTPLEFLVMSRVAAFTADELCDWEGVLSDKVEDLLREPNYGVYNVMLVRHVRGIYFREGLGRILVESLERCLDPGPTWADVLLG